MPPFPSPAVHFPSLKFSPTIQCCFLWLVNLSLLTGTLAAQSPQDTPMLEIGKPIERELAGDGAHSYSITLAAKQFLRVVVEQKGIDVVVTLFAPDGNKLIEVDSPNGTAGPEPISFVTDTAGNYRLEVRSLEAKAAPGRYEAKVEELRAANPSDKSRIAAQQALEEATQLQNEGSAASFRKAIDKYEVALALLRETEDRAKEADTLINIGKLYNRLSENQKALDYFNKALPITRAIGARGVEALALYKLGGVYDSFGEKQQALDNYNQALSLVRAVGDRQGEGATLNELGSVYKSMGEKQKALDYLNQALPLRRAAGDRRGEAETLTTIGGVYEELGERQKALEYYNQALPIRRAVADRGGEAYTLNNIGTLYDSLGEKQKALDHFNQSLLLRRATGNRVGEATALNNIGWVYSSQGERQKALDYYDQALAIRRAVGDRSGEAATLHNFGLFYDSIGEKQKALTYYNQALAIRRAVFDRSGEAAALNNIGLVYGALGENQKALDFYNQALPLRRAVGDRNGEASTLHNIGLTYETLGERQKALDYLILASTLSHALGDRYVEAYTLTGIGGIYRSLGENQKALDYHNQALVLRRAVGDRRGEAYTLNSIGWDYNDLGEKHKALEYHRQSLPLNRAVGDRGGEAITLNSIGFVYYSLGEKQKAFEYYNQALPLRRAVGDRGGEATTLANIATVERDRGNLTEARGRIEEALTIVESLRNKITSQELRASYFATVQTLYDLYIDILMRLHKQQPSKGLDGTALQASERRRARSLLETLAEAGADIRQGVDPKLVERERSLQQQLNGKAQAQTKLLNSKHTVEQAETMAKEIDALTIEFQQVETEIRQKSPNYAALTQPEPLTLKELQDEVLDKDTLLLEYSLGEEHSYLWAVTPTSITSYELPKRSEIETLARQVYSLISDAKRWRTEGASASLNDADRLSEMLLAPVATQLGKKRLLIISEGALQYIPFGSLPRPSSGAARTQPERYQPLVITNEIINLPSASTLAVLRQQVKDRRPAAKAVAVLADPVFESNDERIAQNTKAEVSVAPDKSTVSTKRELPLGFERSVGESGLRDAKSKIPRLPGTRAEAMQILALVPPAQRKQAFDFVANRETATSEELSQYRYVHFATHGFLNAIHPELSGLVFSMIDEKGQPQDGFLRAHEIFNLKLPAELVVLSACQTGLGKEIKGEGLVGLTRGFMYAGAPRVVVSLWSVSDQATAELMTRFYRGILKNGLRPAAALRAAQVSLIKEKKWESPFYWAAFTLQGEWK